MIIIIFIMKKSQGFQGFIRRNVTLSFLLPSFLHSFTPPHFFLPPFFLFPIFCPSLLPFIVFFDIILLTFYFPPPPLFLPLYFLDPLCSFLYYLIIKLHYPLLFSFNYFSGCNHILSRKKQHYNNYKKQQQNN